MQITILLRLFFIIAVITVPFVFGIIGGTPAEYYPFFVRVPRGNDFCGGVIVDPKIVLTAAHCLYYNKLHRWATFLEVYVLQVERSGSSKTLYNTIQKNYTSYETEIC